jgi:hypothetical protein
MWRWEFFHSESLIGHLFLMKVSNFFSGLYMGSSLYFLKEGPNTSNNYSIEIELLTQGWKIIRNNADKNCKIPMIHQPM